MGWVNISERKIQRPKHLKKKFVFKELERSPGFQRTGYQI